MIRCSCGAILTSVEAICESCLPTRRPMRASRRMLRCSCGAMLTNVETICETCLPARKPMRASLEEDYREKCAAMLGWKETAEAWERDARRLYTRALAAEAKLADAVEALVGVVNVADRKTKEFDAAREAIAKGEQP